MNKFELLQSVLKEKARSGATKQPQLLDVGCRDCALKPYVAEMVNYVGVDLFQNAQGSVDHVLDVSQGLPFASRSFDYVVALDLVEHLDDFEGGLNELLRVSRSHLVIMLPNLAHAVFRAKFLLEGTLGGKYDMKYGQGRDRHRWLTTLTQSDTLMEDFARDKNLRLTRTWFNDSKKKQRFATVCRVLGFPPNFWIWASLYVLQR